MKAELGQLEHLREKEASWNTKASKSPQIKDAALEMEGELLQDELAAVERSTELYAIDRRSIQQLEETLSADVRALEGSDHGGLFFGGNGDSASGFDVQSSAGFGLTVLRSGPGEDSASFVIRFEAGEIDHRGFVNFTTLASKEPDGRPLVPDHEQLRVCVRLRPCDPAPSSFMQANTATASFFHNVLSSASNNPALVLGSSVIFLAGFLFCSKRARRTASQLFRYSSYSPDQQTSITASTSSEGIYGALENGEKVAEM
ncbi:unnamed protein product [Amoebophrya sp. A25]|nr:unnamed protein product [Amoebophrya sp. A25]|eukprot:GSA25T00014723001.1